MTIAISIKVNDGVVLAADSATTLLALDPQHGAPVVVNVYNSADKVFNLRKGLPIGVITWGAGNIGAASNTMVETANYEQFRHSTSECVFPLRSLNTQSTISASYAPLTQSRLAELQDIWHSVSSRVISHLSELARAQQAERMTRLRMQAESALSYYTSAEATAERMEWQAGDFTDVSDFVDDGD